MKTVLLFITPDDLLSQYLRILDVPLLSKLLELLFRFYLSCI
jgi:hypothetical protein